MKKFDNQEWQDSYEHDHSFRQKVDQAEQEYQVFLHKAKEQQERGFRPIINDSMVQKFISDNYGPIYFVYGVLQPPPKQYRTELLLNFVLNFRPDAGEHFNVVYFNQHTPSSDTYFEFKRMFAVLPPTIQEKVKEFWVVSAGWYIKCFDMLDWLGMGSMYAFASKAYHIADNCQQICDHFQISVHDFVSFVPEEISEEFPSKFKRRPSLVSYRMNVQGQNLSEQELKDKRDFEFEIKALITKEVYKLQNYELNDLGIPIILQVLVFYFRSKPEGLKEEGIFRKSVSVDEQNETLTELSRQNYNYLDKIKNPHLVASLIKKFFSNLKEPVIPFGAFKIMMHDQGVTDKHKLVRQAIQSLPKINFLSLAFLFQFLRNDVLPHEKESKMSLHNLAICFSPSLMRSQKTSMADLIYASKSVNVTEILITDYNQIFGSEVEITKIFKKNLKQGTKVFEKEVKQEIGIQYKERQSEASSVSMIADDKRFQEVEESPAVGMLKGSAGPRRKSRIFEEKPKPKAKSQISGQTITETEQYLDPSKRQESPAQTKEQQGLKVEKVERGGNEVQRDSFHTVGRMTVNEEQFFQPNQSQ